MSRRVRAMIKHVHRKSKRTAAETSRLRADRERYQREKPTPEQLLAEGGHEGFVPLGDLWEPEMPPRDAKGNYPALATLAAIQARDILRTRKRLGLSQGELARLAGIRPETLNRIEHGRNEPSVPTMAKIDRALQKAEKAAEKAAR